MRLVRIKPTPKIENVSVYKAFMVSDLLTLGCFFERYGFGWFLGWWVFGLVDKSFWYDL